MLLKCEYHIIFVEKENKNYYHLLKNKNQRSYENEIFPFVIRCNCSGNE